MEIGYHSKIKQQDTSPRKYVEHAYDSSTSNIEIKTKEKEIIPSKLEIEENIERKWVESNPLDLENELSRHIGKKEITHQIIKKEENIESKRIDPLKIEVDESIERMDVTSLIIERKETVRSIQVSPKKRIISALKIELTCQDITDFHPKLYSDTKLEEECNYEEKEVSPIEILEGIKSSCESSNPQNNIICDLIGEPKDSDMHIITRKMDEEDTTRKDPMMHCKIFSSGNIELKADNLRDDIGSSSERTKTTSGVPVTIKERMEKDPILARHFAQLESPKGETVSDFINGSQRLLNTTNRLRRTIDSVGIKYMNQYIVIKLLGCGTYGKVKLCLNTMDCKLYAVKIVHRKWLTRRSIGGTTDEVGQGAMREIAIMKKLNHPNIVALHEVIDDPSNRKLYLVLEYVEGGPILANDKWIAIPEDKTRLYFRDICQGLDYLHFNKVVHRDLKPGNLLQTLDGKIKISDFGVSHMFEQESDCIHDTAGTPAFLAPEICATGECQGRVADMWALGVCLYVIVFGRIPFPGETLTEIYHNIINKETLILTKDPNLRISLAGIMQHEWVTRNGLEPLIPFKVHAARGSIAMAVSEDEVQAAIGINREGLAALCIVDPIEKTFEVGEYIMRQGDEGQEMYFINSGLCEVLVESRSLTQPSRGRMEYAIAQRGPGQYIGEMKLQTNEKINTKPSKRTASIRAKTRVVTLVVSRDKVMEVMSKNVEAAQSIENTIAEREREMRKKLKALDLRMPSIRLENDSPMPKPLTTCSNCKCSLI